MKAKKLVLHSPCSEKRENMTPNLKGSYCSVCEKNVIDFTKLSEKEIAYELKIAKGNICARVTKSQLEQAIPIGKAPMFNSIPYAKIAACFMVFTTLATTQVLQAENIKFKTEWVAKNDVTTPIQLQHVNSLQQKDIAAKYIELKGQIITAKEAKPMEHVKVSLVTIHRVYTTTTDKNGKYSIRVAKEHIDDDNVIRVSYNDYKSPGNSDVFYETENYILSEAEIKKGFNVKAQEAILYDGGICAEEEKTYPTVLYKGEEVKYKEFERFLRGKSILLAGTNYYYFYGDFAKAIYGKSSKDGLYVFFDKQ